MPASRTAKPMPASRTAKPMPASRTARGTGAQTGSRTGAGPLCCGAVTEAPLSDDQANELASVLSALGDPVRLRLLSLIAGQGEVCSCNLEEPLGKSQPTVSHHTSVLSDAGLIRGEKRGKWVWWQVVPDRLAAVRQALGGR